MRYVSRGLRLLLHQQQVVHPQVGGEMEAAIEGIDAHAGAVDQVEGVAKTGQDLSGLFDDLIGETVHLFRAFPEVLEQYQNKFKHILVDEYQDTNDSQEAFLKLITNVELEFPGRAIPFVVDDRDAVVDPDRADGKIQAEADTDINIRP